MKSISDDFVSVTFKVARPELERFDRIAKEKQVSRAALLRLRIIETNKKFAGDLSD